MTIKILDLFAGVCGLSLGFEMIKDKNGKNVFEMYRAVEIDKYACETIRMNHDNKKVIEGDITDKNIHRKIIKECKGKVSIIVGGIPCQSFSLIGPRSGSGKNREKFRSDKRDNLYHEFRDIVKQIMPNVVVIENVRGILSKKDKSENRIIDKLIFDFEKLGYNFRNNKDRKKYMILNAADYGVPQKRERVILVGIKKTWKNVNIPYVKPTHGENLLSYVTIYDAIADLPNVRPKITNTGLSDRIIKKIAKDNKKINSGQERIILDKKRFNEHIRRIGHSGRNFLNFVRPNGYKYIDDHIARSQQLSDIKLFSLMKQGETAADFMKRKPAIANKLIKYDMKTFKDKYRKQKWSKPCTTVFAHLEKDGNRFIHPGQTRTITPREAARIQSFPDDYRICGPMSKKFRQIGNAVPPLMAYNIAKTVFDKVYK